MPDPLPPEVLAAIDEAGPAPDLDALTIAGHERLFELLAESVWTTGCLPEEPEACVARAMRETSGPGSDPAKG